MAYITTEQVKEIRNRLKKQFPRTKMSITRKDYSGVRISILSSDIKFTEEKYKSVNDYHIKDNYDGIVRDSLQKIINISNSDVSYSDTADYGSQPSHYVWLSIGEYNKPFEYTGK